MLSLSRPDGPRRHATNYRIGRNILRHHCTRSHHGTIADRDVLQDHRIRCDPDVIAYGDRALGHSLIVDEYISPPENVIVRAQYDIRTDQDVVANGDVPASPRIDHDVGVGTEVVADADRTLGRRIELAVLGKVALAPDADAAWTGDAHIGLDRQFRGGCGEAEMVINAPQGNSCASRHGPEEGLDPVLEFANKQA